MKIKKAVFPVAGLGVRFLPATKSIPKEMLPIIDRPLIQFAVDEAKAAGIEEFIFVNGRGKTAIENYFDYSYELCDILKNRSKVEELKALENDLPCPGQIFYTRQQHVLGLGHAIWCARHFINDEPFAVILVDDYILCEKPCLEQMVDVFEEVEGNVIAVTEVPSSDTDKYGIVSIAKESGKLVEITGLVEKPNPENAPSNLSIVGRYILSPKVLDHLALHQKGIGNEIQLTDAMEKLIGHQPFHGVKYEGKRFDCGTKSGYIQAIIATALKNDFLKDDLIEFLRKINLEG